jgi:Reverse transcriptase (RNA-dependent DNA polymerase)
VSSFDSVSKEWLVRFAEHRIGDKRIIRLIRKWLKAGVLEEGVATVSEAGTAQGALISPLLANIYMHYVLDLWADRWRRREAQGDVVIVRYADDFVVEFAEQAHAPADTRAGPLAGAGRQGLLCISRGSHEPREHSRLCGQFSVLTFGSS